MIKKIKCFTNKSKVVNVYKFEKEINKPYNRFEHYLTLFFDEIENVVNNKEIILVVNENYSGGTIISMSETEVINIFEIMKNNNEHYDFKICRIRKTKGNLLSLDFTMNQNNHNFWF